MWCKRNEGLSRKLKGSRPTLLAITLLILVYYKFKFLNHNISQPIEKLHQQPPKQNKAFQEPVRGEENIFFLETSCIQQSTERYLNPRQACAIESAARHNPSHKIYLLHTCDMALSGLPQHVRELLLYENVWFWKLNASLFVAGTPIEKWWMEEGIRSSKFPVSHASDVFRYLTLWKYGGTYMDLDVVVLKTLAGLSNFFGAEDWQWVAAGVLNVDADGLGHQFAEECLQELQRSFKGDQWGYNGPELVTRILRKWCNVFEVQQMTPQRCKGFKVLPPKTFYPIHYDSWKRYFEEHDPSTGYLFNLTQDSLAVHVWNSLSSDTPINIGSNQTYALLAAENCPRVYTHCELNIF